MPLAGMFQLYQRSKECKYSDNLRTGRTICNRFKALSMMNPKMKLYALKTRGKFMSTKIQENSLILTNRLLNKFKNIHVHNSSAVSLKNFDQGQNFNTRNDSSLQGVLLFSKCCNVIGVVDSDNVIPPHTRIRLNSAGHVDVMKTVEGLM